VPLPDLSHLPPLSIVSDLRRLGVTWDFVRAHTLGIDDLRGPLTPTREARLSDAPAFAALRSVFCGGDFHVRWVRDLLLFSDYLDSEADAVMGAGETTAILFSAAAPRTRLQAVLDLGCGAGTLALLLARNAERVIATDINPRAVALAQYNAAVNQIANAQFRTGDLFAPVAGEVFEVIVSQPPYYPGSELTFLHAGPRGDEIASRVLDGIPAALASGGRALVFTSWPEGMRHDTRVGIRLLEISTDRRELHGTRQSITVVEHAGDRPSWAARFRVAPEVWGDISAARIDELMDAQDLLRAHELPRLCMVGGLHVDAEGDALLLSGPRGSLIGARPITPDYWQALQCLHPSVLRRGLEEGLLGRDWCYGEW
jgi:SAM-dependent methyltransferase